MYTRHVKPDLMYICTDCGRTEAAVCALCYRDSIKLIMLFRQADVIGCLLLVIYNLPMPAWACIECWANIAGADCSESSWT